MRQRILIALLLAGMFVGGVESPAQPPPGVAKRGVEAALAIDSNGKPWGTAFCIRGLGPESHLLTFVQADADGKPPVVSNPRWSVRKVLAFDRQVGLAMLKGPPLPALELGRDETLKVGGFVTVVGTLRPDKPRGRAVGPVAHGRRIAGLPRVDGVPHTIQLDKPLDPGFAGGPLLDAEGRIVGMLVMGANGKTVDTALPIGRIRARLNRCRLSFNPSVKLADIHREVLLQAVADYPFDPERNADLRLTLDMFGRQLRLEMDASKRPTHGALATLLPLGESKLTLVVKITSGDDTIVGRVADQPLQVGERRLSLLQVASIDYRSVPPRIRLHGSETLADTLVGWRELRVTFGGQEQTVDLGEMDRVRFQPPSDLAPKYTLTAFSGGQEVGRVEGRVTILDIPSPDRFEPPRKPAAEAQNSLAQPVTGQRSDSKAKDATSAEGTSERGRSKEPSAPLPAGVKEVLLRAPITDVRVGARGQCLVLYQPAIRKLAIYDVGRNRVRHEIPTADPFILFDAGLRKLLVVLPDSGVVQRWDLETGKRDAVAALPPTMHVTAMALGAAGTDSALLFGYDLRASPGPRSVFQQLDLDTLGLASCPLDAPPIAYPGNEPLRASRDNRLFSLERRVIQLADASNRGAVPAVNAPLPLLPDAAGRYFFTTDGILTSEGQRLSDAPRGIDFVPAHDGDYFVVGLYRPSTGSVPAGLSVFSSNPLRYLAAVPEIDTRTYKTRELLEALPVDKRLHYVSQANVIITIPPGEDRLRIHPVELAGSEDARREHAP